MIRTKTMARLSPNLAFQSKFRCSKTKAKVKGWFVHLEEKLATTCVGSPDDLLLADEKCGSQSRIGFKESEKQSIWMTGDSLKLQTDVVAVVKHYPLLVEQRR